MPRTVRSLLDPDVVLRIAAMLLAAVIVVRSLFAGANGLWSITLVLGTAALFWGLVRLAARLRVMLAESNPEVSPDTSQVTRARAPQRPCRT